MCGIFFFLVQLSAIAFNMRKSVSFNSFQLPPHNRFPLFPQLRATAVGWPEKHGHKRKPTLYGLLYSLVFLAVRSIDLIDCAIHFLSLVGIHKNLSSSIYLGVLLRIEMLNGECLDRIMCESTQSSNWIDLNYLKWNVDATEEIVLSPRSSWLGDLLEETSETLDSANFV